MEMTILIGPSGMRDGLVSAGSERSREYLTGRASAGVGASKEASEIAADPQRECAHVPESTHG